MNSHRHKLPSSGLSWKIQKHPVSGTPSAQRKGFARKSAAYFALTKPRVMELLLVTTLPTMIFAEGGFPPFGLVLGTMVGGALAAGSAGAFNGYFDRDIDKIMRRTRNRPLVTGDITPREALAFSWVLAALSMAVLWSLANPLAALLGAGAIFIYVVIYTLILKRRTVQNIVWGGAAGCMPVLIAWAAVRDSIEWPALVLFLIIFLWTPPHYWPLSMKYKDDYNAVDVPMLGSVAGAKTVGARIVVYSWAMVASSMLLVLCGAGWTFTVTGLVAGGWFLRRVHLLHSAALRGEESPARAMSVFHGSISYLTVLFLALALDPFIGGSVL